MDAQNFNFAAEFFLKNGVFSPKCCILAHKFLEQEEHFSTIFRQPKIPSGQLIVSGDLG